MFSKKEHIIKKTGPAGVGRYQYLKLLVQEFGRSNSSEPKEQVLANLANFAYDPINYEFLRQLHVIDIFLREIGENNSEDLLHFALAGLCNLCCDPVNAQQIIHKNGVHLISRYLLHHNIEISLNALATIIFLITPETQPIITTPAIISKVLRYKSSSDPRMSNLGNLFLQDYCAQQQIEYANKSLTDENLQIPS